MTDPDTRPSRAAYQRQRRHQSVTLYFRTPTELAQAHERARAGGYENFNAWILQMLDNAASGSVYPPEYVDGLRKDADKLRAWLETSREENADYRTQLKTLQAQRDNLLVLLHGIPDGAEIAAQFLKQSAAHSGVLA